ncbi:MAG TPA: hypothetical protein VGL38_05110 [bacterium]|jgi:hypothetical protein
MVTVKQFLAYIGKFAFGSLLLLLLTGCYVASIHPLAALNQRIFDKELVGGWANGHDTLRISGENIDNLEFDVTEGPSVLSDSARSGSLSLLLTNIDDQTFMDVRPADVQESKSPILEQMLLVPMHAIIRYTIHQDTLSIQYLNYTELRRLSEAGKLRGLDVENVADDGPIVITSSTSKLRDFLSDHKKDDQLYADPIHYLRLKP